MRNIPIYPLDVRLKNQCDDIIRHNFQRKGNSWQDRETVTDEFLISKLTEEFCEVIQILTHRDNHNKVEALKELADLINVSAMIHNRLR